SVFGVLAADGPLDLDHVADLQAGEGDDQLLLGVVDLVVGADVAKVDVARLDLDRLARQLVDAGGVEGQLLIAGGEGDVAILAELFDTLAAVESGQLVRGDLDGAILL